MKQSASISSRIKSRIVEVSSLPENVKKISYSQFSIYSECQHRWYLTYGKKLYPFSSSIDTVFGTALHETLQHYLELLYNDSVKASEAFNYAGFLRDAMSKAYGQEKEKNAGKNFTTSELMEEYYLDGLEIMRFLIKKRKEIFDTKNFELVGIEIPLATPVKEGESNIWFQGYLDIVLYDKIYQSYLIIDVKTSKAGWREYQKKDEKKIAQVLLYKSFFAKQFGIEEEKVEIKFMILKRKLWEDSQYAQSRVQNFAPANGKAKVKGAVTNLLEFVNHCFDDNGVILNNEYPKNPGTNFNNCRFCPFVGTEHCDQNISK